MIHDINTYLFWSGEKKAMVVNVNILFIRDFPIFLFSRIHASC
jgi:hypothetical protein